MEFNSMAAKLEESFAKQKQLYNTTQRKVQQMAILQEAVAAIASHLSFEPLLEELSLLSALLVKAELSALVILHPETGEIQHFKANISPEEFPVKGYLLRVSLQVGQLRECSREEQQSTPRK